MENTKQKKKKSEILNNQRRYDLRSNSVAKHKRDGYILASQASDSLNSSIGWKKLSTFSHDNERKLFCWKNNVVCILPLRYWIGARSLLIKQEFIVDHLNFNCDINPWPAN